VRRLTALAADVSTVMIIACSSSTAASTTVAAKITVLAGAGQSDTIQATLPTLLTVQVSGSDATGVIVQFVSADSTGAYVSPASSLSAPTSFLADTSDATGKASARIALGTHAGKSRIIIRVPTLSLVDTATFMVTPGAAANLTIAPQDTTVYVGGAFAVRAALVDRFGNARTDPVPIGHPQGPIVLAGGDTVRAQTYGLASVLATVGSLVDTLRFTVVPTGQLAAIAASGIVRFNLDGSGYQQLTAASGYERWSPSGERIVYALGYWLQSVDTTGLASLLGPEPPGGLYDQFPQYSRDGQWVYFSRYDGANVNTLWRVAATGQGTPQNVSTSQDAYAPSPSPDGSQLVHVRHVNDEATLTILTLATDAVDSLTVSGTVPVWAPTGNLIAFVNADAGSPLYLVKSDGTGQRLIGTPGAVYGYVEDWSPDGQWIVAENQSAGYFEVINVSSNLVLPLRYTRGLTQPIWRP
jgi:WD40-like Beta Propeller Repeat